MAEAVLALVVRGRGALVEGMGLPVDAAALGLAPIQVLVVNDALVEADAPPPRVLRLLRRQPEPEHAPSVRLRHRFDVDLRRSGRCHNAQDPRGRGRCRWQLRLCLGIDGRQLAL